MSIIQPSPPRRLVLDVKDFGAVGDGLTNDTPSIQAAINAASASGQPEGAIVFIPRGTYRLAATVYIEKAIALQGEGSSSEANGSVLLVDGSTNGIEIQSAATAGTPGQDGTGATIAGLRLVAAAKTGWAAGIYSHTRAHVRDCSVDLFGGSGIVFNPTAPESAKHWTIERCTVTDCDAHGVEISSGGGAGETGFGLGSQILATGNFYGGIIDGDTGGQGSTWISCHCEGNDPTNNNQFSVAGSTRSCFINCHATPGSNNGVPFPATILGGNLPNNGDNLRIANDSSSIMGNSSGGPNAAFRNTAADGMSGFLFFDDTGNFAAVFGHGNAAFPNPAAAGMNIFASNGDFIFADIMAQPYIYGDTVNFRVGVGIDNPTQKLDVDGMIRSRSGGIMFPDNTIQITAGGGGGISLGAVGASPNANGATLTGPVLNLEPADSSNPGVVTAAAQNFGGFKTFDVGLSANGSAITLVGAASNPGDALSLYEGSRRLAPSILSFGAASIGLVTEFAPPGYSAAGVADEVGFVVPVDGKLRDLNIRANTGPGGDSIVFTIRVNGVDDALTATLGIGGTSASDLANEVTVLAGDEVTIRAVPGGGISSAALALRASCRFTLDS